MERNCRLNIIKFEIILQLDLGNKKPPKQTPWGFENGKEQSSLAESQT